MANRRMICKSISVSSQVNRMSLFSQLLYTWMIPHADDWGRMDADPGVIWALVIPRYRSLSILPNGREIITVTEDLIAASLNEMALAKDEAGQPLILLYEANGKRYFQYPNWEDYQSGLHKRSASKFPEYNGNTQLFPELPGTSGTQTLTENNTLSNISEDIAINDDAALPIDEGFSGNGHNSNAIPGTSRKIPEIPSQLNLTEQKGTEQKGTEQNIIIMNPKRMLTMMMVTLFAFNAFLFCHSSYPAGSSITTSN